MRSQPVFLLMFFISGFGFSNAGAQTADPNLNAVADSLPQPEIVYYFSDSLKLKAYLYKPKGTGIFPVYLWNHGSEKDPKADKKLAKFWTDHGFIFFKPIRSGHSDNPGAYICDQENEIYKKYPDKAEAFKYKVKLHERADHDVIAAYKWIQKQTFADPKTIIVAGGSYGGIQTLLASERNGLDSLGIKCFVAMSPAAMSWGPGWENRLKLAIKNSKAPIFLLQAKNDFNLGPSDVLGPLIDAKGFPSRHKIFPVHLLPGGDINDHQQGHGKFFGDPSAWQEDVLKYLSDCGIKTMQDTSGK